MGIIYSLLIISIFAFLTVKVRITDLSEKEKQKLNKKIKEKWSELKKTIKISEKEE